MTRKAPAHQASDNSSPSEPVIARFKRRTIGTSPMHREIDQQRMEIQSTRQLITRDISLLREQLPILERIRSNTMIPVSMQRAAGANLVDTQASITESEGFLRQIDHWLGSSQQLQHDIRRSDATYPDSEEGQSRYALLEQNYRVITLVRDAMQNSYMLLSNTNLYDQLMAHERQSAESTTPTNLLEIGSHNHLLGGAISVGQDVPEGIRTLGDGYYASWDTQARFFAQGSPIEGNTHHRRYTFSDGSHVDIQAHLPTGTTSDESDAYLAGLAAVGATGGAAGGPLGAFIGSISAALLGNHLRPNDAAWQGYTARYFFAGAPTESPWKVRYFYGWGRSSDPGSALVINGTDQPHYFPNFADHPDQYAWYDWNSGNADLRPAESQHALPSTSPSSGVDLLAQSMETFATERTSALGFQPSITDAGNHLPLMASAR